MRVYRVVGNVRPCSPTPCAIAMVRVDGVENQSNIAKQFQDRVTRTPGYNHLRSRCETCESSCSRGAQHDFEESRSIHIRLLVSVSVPLGEIRKVSIRSMLSFGWEESGA